MPSPDLQLFPNPRAERRPYSAAEALVVSRAAHDRARAEIASWPGYSPTPLVRLVELAASLGVGAVWYKDEAGRFGLGAFKALGGAYGVYRALAAEAARRTGAPEPSSAELMRGGGAGGGSAAAGVTVTCATDGNHGRAVAWGVRLFGGRAVIFLPAAVSPAREAAIRAYGAETVRVDGSYDDAVRRAAEAGRQPGWIVVSDTSYPGYEEIPAHVMQGYTVLAEEALAQLPPGAPPTHLFLQAGVGGLAAAVAGHFWEALGAGRPTVVVVEPERAACLYESARAGRPVTLEGDLDTVMAMLSCGEPSLLAWQLLERGADVFATVPDAAAVRAMRVLAEGRGGDPAIVAGESGAAGLAALLLAAESPEHRSALGLDEHSHVLLIGTEGATDPEIYARLMGEHRG
jgi:diaminopropionate ammonia-lyase